MIKTKICSNCFKEKPIDQFYRKGKTGYQSRCKTCNPEVCYAYANKNRPDKLEKYFGDI